MLSRRKVYKSKKNCSGCTANGREMFEVSETELHAKSACGN